MAEGTHNLEKATGKYGFSRFFRVVRVLALRAPDDHQKRLQSLIYRFVQNFVSNRLQFDIEN